MSDLDICASIAANIDENSWASLFAKFDKDTFDKIQTAILSHKDVADTKEEKISDDPSDAIKQLNTKLTKIVKGLKAHRKRFDRIEQQNKSLLARVTQVEQNNAVNALVSSASTRARPKARHNRRISNYSDYEASIVANNNDNDNDDGLDDLIKTNIKKKKPRKKLKSMAKLDDIKENDTSTKARLRFYRFGSRNLQVVKPTNGYPDKKHAQRPVEGHLKLFYAHGYSGNFDDSRQNIYLSKDGSLLIYYIAAIAVVYDYNNNSQKFFAKHNDDLTALCVAPHKPWAATGQKDPKDEPGQGQDLPKIWIWNYKTMKQIQLIDNVCWGKIARLQWSKKSKLLYCICGDPQQALKAYNPDDFTGKKEPVSLIDVNTTKEAILGFEINDNPNKVYVDEFIIFGKRKFSHCGITEKGKKLQAKIKSVSIAQFAKLGEKSYACCQWLPDGRYIVGSKSGTIYVCKNRECLSIVKAHSRTIGCLVVTDNNTVISAGWDKLLKTWEIKAASGSNSSSSTSSSNDDNDTDDNKSDKPTKKGDKSPKKSKKSKKDKDKDKSTSKSDKKGAVKSIRSKFSKQVKSTKGKLKKTIHMKLPDALEEKWSYEVDLPDTDYILQPKAMAYNNKTGTLFVGSKTNQIMKFEMKEEKGEVIVDGHDGAIWGLCTHPTEDLFATGGYDNAVKIWDANTMTCIKTYEFELEQGDKKGHEISCGHWSNDGTILAFGTENTSCIAVFHWNNDNQELSFQQLIEIPPKSATAEVEPVSYLRFNEDSTLLAAAHYDSNLYIYSIQSGSNTVVLQQWPVGLPHCAAPVNVQFSADGKLVKTLTRDYEVVHWFLDTSLLKGKFIPQIPDPDKIKWADDPLIAGWDVEGLYQKGWDGTDLNDATITSDGRLVATGDDYGKVRLHNYPSTDNKTCLEYGGHAEFVVGVEFLRDDSQLITCGGADMAIFQWKCFKNYKD